MHRNRATRAGAGAAPADLLAHAMLIRFLYPLTIPDAQFDAAMKILQDGAE
ncbi:hypothetical protein ACLK1S_08120 [Escherichia coli]